MSSKNGPSTTTPSGIYPILFAYFDENESLHEANMRKQVRTCLDWGVDGIAALGLATEVGKLTNKERRDIIDWVCEEVANSRPVAITLAEQSVKAQVDLGKHALSGGAGWLILQPAAVKNLSELEHLRFLGRIADALPAPIAIQNAPDYLGVSLSNRSLKELNRQHPNVSILKAEGSSSYIRRLMDETDGVFTVFNGRGGLEFTDNIRAGCAGMIPAPESCDIQTRILQLMNEGTPESMQKAEQLYMSMLPLITFLIQSVEHFLCYGKRLFAKRAGLEEVFDRGPSVRPEKWAEEATEQHAKSMLIGS